MAQVKIDIVAQDSRVSFQPTPQSVTPADDLFWVNNDETSAHQPTPDASDPTAWMPYPIQAKRPGLPAPQSRGLTFAAKKVKGKGKGSYQIAYVCALHPLETGTIEVIGKNKKGAFAGVTFEGGRVAG